MDKENKEKAKEKTKIKRKVLITLIIIVILMSILICVVIVNIKFIFILLLEKRKLPNDLGPYKMQIIHHRRNNALEYEEVQKLSKLFPNSKFRGKIYYNIYGKKVYENDEFVDFSDVKIDNEFMSKLKLLTNIKEIYLYNSDLTNNEKLEISEEFPNVRFYWPVKVLNEDVNCNIEELDLSYERIQNIGDFKTSLKLLPNLKKLDMSYTNLSNEQLGNLREQFPNIRIDWVVRLGKWSLRTDRVAFSVLIYKYDYKRMTSKDIQVLKYCTELKALDLGHQEIEDISIIGDYLPNLRVLILADNKIKDISPLAKLKHLHYLELFMNDITDATPLAECKELVDLNISFNYRFSNIDGILNLPLLERLWLVSDRIPAASYKIIREKYPDVRLVTTGTGSTDSGWRTHERYFEMINMYKDNYISELFLQYDSLEN